MSLSTGICGGDDLRRVIGMVVPWHFKLQNVPETFDCQRMPARSAAINTHDSKLIGLERFTVHIFGERSWRKTDVDRLVGER